MSGFQTIFAVVFPSALQNVGFLTFRLLPYLGTFHSVSAFVDYPHPPFDKYFYG